MDTLWEVALTAAYCFLFTAIVCRASFFRLPGIPSYWMVGAFWLKLAAGAALWAVYTWYYSQRNDNDAYRYYDDARIIRSLLKTDPALFFRFMTGIGLDPEAASTKTVFDKLHGWTSMYTYGLTHDSPTIIRMHVIIGFFSLGYYHIHTAFSCFLAFVGLTGFFRAFRPLLIHRERALFASCFLLPSVVFWSSGLLKEGPLVLVLGLFLYHFFRLLDGTSGMRSVLVILFCTWVLIYLKIYVLLSMLPAVFFYAIVTRWGHRFLLVKFVVIHVFFLVSALYAGSFFSGGDLLHILEKKRLDFYHVAETVGAGSMVHIPESPSVTSFLLHYPQAFILTYFRPFLFERPSWLFLFTGIENLLYALLFVLALVRWKKPPAKTRALWLFALSFVLIMAVIVGNTVPILGAVVRYRIVTLPLFVILCLHVIRPWKASSVAEALQGD